jgi:L-rhamnose mutarotase
VAHGARRRVLTASTQQQQQRYQVSDDAVAVIAAPGPAQQQQWGTWGLTQGPDSMNAAAAAAISDQWWCSVTPLAESAAAGAAQQQQWAAGVTHAHPGTWHVREIKSRHNTMWRFEQQPLQRTCKIHSYMWGEMIKPITYAAHAASVEPQELKDEH